MNTMESILDSPEKTILPVYGTFMQRLLAAFIDGLIMSAVNFGIGMLFVGSAVADPDLMAGDNPDAMAGFMSRILATYGIGIVLNWLYFSYLESSEKQATFGKQALGLKVTDMNGNRISFLNATGRYFGKFISALIMLIGYIMQAFTEKKQTLHDIMAGTLVVKGGG